METVFLSKIPIFDSQGRVFGFEVKFDFDVSEKSVDLNLLVKRLYAVLKDIGMMKSLGGKPAFISLMTDVIIFTDFTSLLPKETFVIKVLSNQLKSKSLIDKIKELKVSGYRFCLSGISVGEINTTLDEGNFQLFDYFELEASEILNLADDAVAELLTKLQKIMATEVETYEDFRTLKDRGVPLFKGDFFTKPEKIEFSIENFSKIETLRLIRLVHQEEDLNTIAEYIKASPSISLNLLRYINSSYFYLAEPITSVNRAVIYLGKKNLINWLILLSMISVVNSDVKRELLKMVLFRAKSMELLSRKINLDKSVADTAFFVGMISFSEAVFNTPLETVLKEFQIKEDLAKDVREKTGFFGKLILLVELIEKNKVKEAREILEGFMLNYSDIAGISIDALKWSEEMSSVLYK